MNKTVHKFTVISIKLFGAEHISQSAYVSVVDFFPGLDHLNATLIDVAKTQYSLQIIDTICFYVSRFVTNCLIAECTRFVIYIYLLIVKRHQIVVVFYLGR